MSDDDGGNGIEVLDISGGGDGDGFNLSEHWRKIVATVIAMFLLVVVFTSFFQVDTDSVGVVLRFGKYHRTVEPGLHMKFPLGIEEHEVVPTRKQLKEEFGFRTIEAEEETTYDRSGYEEESQMLTGDLNVVNVEWTIQYRINDPLNYLFEVREVGNTLRYVTQAVMREIVGDRTVTEVLTVGRADLAEEVHEELERLTDRYEMGVGISDVILQDITPPEPVRPSFDEVNQAQQDRERLINEARRDYNAAVPRARGEAEQVIQRAEGYKTRRVNRAEGQVARFTSLYDEYVEAPEITRQRIYLEALEETLNDVDDVVILDRDAENTVPLLSPGGSGAIDFDVSGQQQGGGQ